MKGRLSTKVWILLLAALFLLLAAAALLLSRQDDGRKVAEIYLDGELVRRIDLSALDEEIEFTIESDGQENVIRARKGAICIASANCPDQICVRRGWVSGGATPIVCLPHKVVIQFETAQDSEIDAIAG